MKPNTDDKLSPTLGSSSPEEVKTKRRSRSFFGWRRKSSKSASKESATSTHTSPSVNDDFEDPGVISAPGSYSERRHGIDNPPTNYATIAVSPREHCDLPDVPQERRWTAALSNMKNVRENVRVAHFQDRPAVQVSDKERLDALEAVLAFDDDVVVHSDTTNSERDADEEENDMVAGSVRIREDADEDDGQPGFMAAALASNSRRPSKRMSAHDILRAGEDSHSMRSDELSDEEDSPTDVHTPTPEGPSGTSPGMGSPIEVAPDASTVPAVIHPEPRRVIYSSPAVPPLTLQSTEDEDPPAEKPKPEKKRPPRPGRRHQRNESMMGIDLDLGSMVPTVVRPTFEDPPALPYGSRSVHASPHVGEDVKIKDAEGWRSAPLQSSHREALQAAEDDAHRSVEFQREVDESAAVSRLFVMYEQCGFRGDDVDNALTAAEIALSANDANDTNEPSNEDEKLRRERRISRETQRMEELLNVASLIRERELLASELRDILLPVVGDDHANTSVPLQHLQHQPVYQRLQQVNMTLFGEMLKWESTYEQTIIVVHDVSGAEGSSLPRNLSSKSSLEAEPLSPSATAGVRTRPTATVRIVCRDQTELDASDVSLTSYISQVEESVMNHDYMMQFVMDPSKPRIVLSSSSSKPMSRVSSRASLRSMDSPARTGSLRLSRRQPKADEAAEEALVSSEEEAGSDGKPAVETPQQSTEPGNTSAVTGLTAMSPITTANSSKVSNTGGLSDVTGMSCASEDDVLPAQVTITTVTSGASDRKQLAIAVKRPQSDRTVSDLASDSQASISKSHDDVPLSIDMLESDQSVPSQRRHSGTAASHQLLGETVRFAADFSTLRSPSKDGLGATTIHGGGGLPLKRISPFEDESRSDDAPHGENVDSQQAATVVHKTSSAEDQMQSLSTPLASRIADLKTRIHSRQRAAECSPCGPYDSPGPVQYSMSRLQASTLSDMDIKDSSDAENGDQDPESSSPSPPGETRTSPTLAATAEAVERSPRAHKENYSHPGSLREELSKPLPAPKQRTGAAMNPSNVAHNAAGAKVPQGPCNLSIMSPQNDLHTAPSDSPYGGKRGGMETVLHGRFGDSTNAAKNEPFHLYPAEYEEMLIEDHSRDSSHASSVQSADVSWRLAYLRSRLKHANGTAESHLHSVDSHNAHSFATPPQQNLHQHLPQHHARTDTTSSSDRLGIPPESSAATTPTLLNDTDDAIGDILSSDVDRTLQRIRILRQYVKSPGPHSVPMSRHANAVGRR